jgi:hypothetical protein
VATDRGDFYVLAAVLLSVPAMPPAVALSVLAAIAAGYIILRAR